MRFKKLHNASDIQTPYLPFLLSLLLLCSPFVNLFSQSTEIDNAEIRSINLLQLQAQIATSPLADAQTNMAPTVIDLPMPGNCSEPFKVWESPIMDAEMAAQYPSIKTYMVSSLGSPTAYGRLTVSHLGIHGTIHSPAGAVDIIPVQNSGNNSDHQVKAVSFEEVLSAKECGMAGEISSKNWEDHLERQEALAAEKSFPFVSGDIMRTYNLAAIVTGEFYEANKDNDNGSANDDADVTAVLTAVVNGVQAYYDRDLAVRFNLLTPVLYNDFNTDPFQPDQEAGASSRTTQAAEQIGISFTLASYDFGHVFHNTSVNGTDWSGGGVAGLGVVCNDGNGVSPSKARGWSGSFNNQGTGFLGLTAHEFGHMFDAPHTFNGDGNNNCNNNISSSNSYEIASGITIMSYNGICGPGQNIPSGGVSDDYFHTRSLTQMISFINNEATCATEVVTGNTPPTVDANSCGGTYVLPISTPFELNGTGSDANGDNITYTWEQYDEDGAGTPTQGFIGAAAAASPIAPNFRNYAPSTSPTRSIPLLGDLLTNTVSDFETLPTVDKVVNFRLTARDNNPLGGGVTCSELVVNFDDVGGPFVVLSPNDGSESWAAGTTETVTWDVAGTTANPINCGDVNIMLSIDGGFTYPYVLATSTTNDGTEDMLIPAGVPNVTTARIRVECATSTCVRFFDISNTDFEISSTCLAVSSYLCPTDLVVAVEGDVALNLTQSFTYGSPTTTETRDIDGTDPIVSRGISNGQGTTDCITSGTRAHESFVFTANASGDYTFTQASGGFLAVSIFEATGFDSANPCNSTFLGSSGYVDGGVSSSWPFTVSLNACTDYIVMMYASSSAYGSNTVSLVSGAGDILGGGTDPGGDYSYTYVAVNKSDNLIDVVSSTADFTALVVGEYDVYGVSYKASGGGIPADVDPSTFVDLSLNDVLGAGNCVVFSSATRSIIVEGPLPVELVSFTGELYGTSNLLTWSTASEENTEWHIVERSVDGGKDWTYIGQLAAAGTSTAILDYKLEDRSPMSKSYYRLRSVDYDRSEGVSDIVYLERQANQFDILAIHPVPANQSVAVEFENAGSRTVQVQVVDLLGRLLHQETIATEEGLNTYRLDVNKWADGVYFISLDNGLQNRTRRIVKH